MMNIPNLLTLLRLLLIPVFVYSYSYLGNLTASVIILAVSGVTDVLDGFIARKFNMITPFGSVFDPLVDKLTQITVALCIALSGHMVMWFVFGFLVIKEIAMVLGGITLYKKNYVVISANWYGKAATTFFYAMFFVLIIFGGVTTRSVEIIVTVVAIGVGIFALVRYAMLFFGIKKKVG